MSETPDAAAAALPTTWSGSVRPEWVDYNGHLRDAFYLLIFSEATDRLMEQVGLDAAGRARTGHTWYTLEAHLNYLLEVKVHEAVQARTRVLALDAKRVQLFHTLHRASDGALLAASEQMQANIDTSGPRTAPFAPEVAQALQALHQAQTALPAPEYAGRRIALPPARGTGTPAA